MSDLVKRLRKFAEGKPGTQHSLNDLDTAADRIEELQTKVERLQGEFEALDATLGMAAEGQAKAEAALERVQKLLNDWDEVAEKAWLTLTAKNSLKHRATELRAAIGEESE